MNDYDKYRPITLLPTVDKIVERIISDEMHNFFSCNNIITQSQFGFLANKSTSSLLSQFTDLVNSHLDNKRHVLVVFIDYSKAFDTLKHETLLKKLDNCGIRGPVLNWCKEYLHDRAYYVKIADTYSSKHKVTVGTAQGSVLGPLHYLTYVNDAPNVVKKCTIFQFADDTCLISAHKDIKTAEQNLQADFTNICEWSHDAGLVLNAEKTVFLHIRSSHNVPDPAVEVKLIAHSHDCLHRKPNYCTCPQIGKKDRQTYLGVVIDDRLTWRYHIDSVCDKLRCVMGKLGVIRHRIPFTIRINLYKSLVESIISYGLSSYGRTFNTYLDRIYSLQLRILKI
ncbi:hypothetical protein JYU34_014938 [Plutella xylostella]|uniref:Reverse transcriptase domain-containing protein n=1 Tax=Plutella xylostella TaxID=51655 RepID=A0ABQ7Q662_PLUXY|nr:hypothetical protein JYU34_014938 [Plutella xylostella]